MTKIMEIDFNPFHQTWKIPVRKNYEDYTTENFYIPMRDGVKIAVTLCLPKGLTSEDKLPTLLYQTRYWRAAELRIPYRWVLRESSIFSPTPELFTSHGYAIVFTDVRGCGASYGTRPYPFSMEEIKDGADIVDWIIGQQWSDGNVVTNGISYTGTTAELLGVNIHPAVKALMPGHGLWDAYTDVAFPGGCFDTAFIRLWSFVGKNLDNNSSRLFKELIPSAWLLMKGVKPVDNDKEKKLLKKAIYDHSSNDYVFDLLNDKDYRDDSIQSGVQIKDVSPFNFISELEKSNVPILSWCSWLDSGYIDAHLNRFNTLKNPHIAIIGAWNHGAVYPADPLHPEKTVVSPSPIERVTTWINFFDSVLYGEGIKEKILYYYTMGEEKWKKSNIWPPKDIKWQKWYFSEENTMSREKPESKTGEDKYKVSFTATSGRLNRWWTLLGLPIDYSKREKSDRKLLTYISAPLQEEIEITGNPTITVYLSSTHEDGAVFAYLEEVDEKGNIHYFTDGNIRLIHHKISPEESLYKITVPHHTYYKKDASLLIPGEITEVTFGFRATSVLIRKGHQLKLAIAGADRDTFKHYPTDGKPTLTIQRNASYTSYINIPIIDRKIK
ncbi:MAG: CocE/NonD family hydrolase [Candidatus Thorarchaeota archaeon]